MVFLDINGYELVEPLDEDAAEDLVLDVAQSRLKVPEIAVALMAFIERV